MASETVASVVGLGMTAVGWALVVKAWMGWETAIDAVAKDTREEYAARLCGNEEAARLNWTDATEMLARLSRDRRDQQLAREYLQTVWQEREASHERDRSTCIEGRWQALARREGNEKSADRLPRWAARAGWH